MAVGGRKGRWRTWVGGVGGGRDGRRTEMAGGGGVVRGRWCMVGAAEEGNDDRRSTTNHPHAAATAINHATNHAPRLLPPPSAPRLPSLTPYCRSYVLLGGGRGCWWVTTDLRRKRSGCGGDVDVVWGWWAVGGATKKKKKTTTTTTMTESRRQLKAMLRKNWLLKIRHPYLTFTEIFLPTVVMLMLMAVQTQVDTRMHSAQPYIRKDMLVEVGKGNISPPFNQILDQLLKNNEYLAFAPNSQQTRVMINLMSLQFPLLKSVARVYKDEMELEDYIRSDLYSTCDHFKNCSNPKIRGAVVFHSQGPQLYDYSIRLNHTWAFSGFPDVQTIMDVNGPYLNDLELGVNTIPIMQYGFSGFLTV
ncbi:hypothetical protein KSS87_008656 [Heliosperma pusillum]|nr:hypothetical protein KSS87_008656 [Heliosperma pusillum]